MTNTSPAALLPVNQMIAAAKRGSSIAATVAAYQRGRRIAQGDIARNA